MCLIEKGLWLSPATLQPSWKWTKCRSHWKNASEPRHHVSHCSGQPKLISNMVVTALLWLTWFGLANLWIVEELKSLSPCWPFGPGGPGNPLGPTGPTGPGSPGSPFKSWKGPGGPGGPGKPDKDNYMVSILYVEGITNKGANWRGPLGSCYIFEILLVSLKIYISAPWYQNNQMCWAYPVPMKTHIWKFSSMLTKHSIMSAPKVQGI